MANTKNMAIKNEAAYIGATDNKNAVLSLRKACGHNAWNMTKNTNGMKGQLTTSRAK